MKGKTFRNTASTQDLFATRCISCRFSLEEQPVYRNIKDTIEQLDREQVLLNNLT